MAKAYEMLGLNPYINAKDKWLCTKCYTHAVPKNTWTDGQPVTLKMRKCFAFYTNPHTHINTRPLGIGKRYSADESFMV